MVGLAVATSAEKAIPWLLAVAAGKIEKIFRNVFFFVFLSFIIFFFFFFCVFHRKFFVYFSCEYDAGSIERNP